MLAPYSRDIRLCTPHACMLSRPTAFLHKHTLPTASLQFFFLKYVDPATYQILGNLKIVTTGIMLRVALKRFLSPIQWIALILLMVGATTSQINTDCTAGAEKTFFAAPAIVSARVGYAREHARMRVCMRVRRYALWQARQVPGRIAPCCTALHCTALPSTFWAWLPGTPPSPPHAHTYTHMCTHHPLQGYIFGVVSATLSAVAAVYTEWVMKKNTDSLYWQNMQLYGFGVVANMLGLAYSSGSSLMLNPLSVFEGGWGDEGGWL
jgi:hypothetical protein